MKPFTTLNSLLPSLVLIEACHGYVFGEWAKPADDALRGPCPMMNTLANHGFLPRNGKNITKENAMIGLRAGLNFDEDLVSLMFDQAIHANPEPNATFFTLGHLQAHNVLEHDASLSRSDAFFGNNFEFNQTIFDASKAWWTGETITPLMLANSKLFRQLESRAFNPEYIFAKQTEEFSLGEVAAPVIAFGNLTTGEVSRALVTYFFENERLPSKLGWHKKNVTVTLKDILSTVSLIRNASDLITSGMSLDASPPRDFHGGMAIQNSIRQRHM
ncbi:peroxidase, family 2 domain-containing protein [Sarocladium implicatum]|nr:peroxidase, family 2 domain-containing protein [Sarocladium implicatum]